MNTWYPFKKKVWFYASILFFAISSPIAAETFILKDGRVLKGKLLKYHSDSIDIQTEDGQYQTLERKEIHKVQYGEDAESEEKQNSFEKGSQEKSSKKNVSNKQTPMKENPNYVLQSTLFPGMGLVSMKRKKEGYTFSGLFFLTALYALYQRNQMIHARENYKYSVQESIIFSYATKSLIPGMIYSQTSYREYQYEESEYQKAALLCGVVYLSQIAWTYFMGKKNSTEKNTFAFQLSPVTTNVYGQGRSDGNLPLQAHFQFQYDF